MTTKPTPEEIRLAHEIATLAEEAFKRGYGYGFTTAQHSTVTPREVELWEQQNPVTVSAHPPPLTGCKDLIERHARHAHYSTAELPSLNRLFDAIMRLPPNERTPPQPQETPHHEKRPTAP